MVVGSVFVMKNETSVIANRALARCGNLLLDSTMSSRVESNEIERSHEHHYKIMRFLHCGRNDIILHPVIANRALAGCGNLL